MTRILLISIVAALAAAGPAVAAPFKGVVVAKQRGVLLVAGSQGTVHAVAGAARVGTRVAVAGTRVRTIGRAHRAVVRGVVVRRSARVTFLSAAGRMLAVHSARRLAAAGTTPASPQPGDVVKSEIEIEDDGDLAEQATQNIGHTGQVSVTATVSAVAAGSVTLSVNGRTLTIPLPAGLTLPSTLVGTQVQLNVSFAGGQPSAQPPGADDDDDQGDDENDDNDSGSSGSGSGGHGDHGSDDGGGDD